MSARITKTNSDFERNDLAAPFGFKGGYVTQIWQAVAYMESASGLFGCGLGTQSTLWSDASVFAGFSEAAGNTLMFNMTEFALKKARDIEFENPLQLLDALLPETYEYGRKITGNTDLRLTFALNALVAVDNAAWQLYARDRGLSSFDEMIPEEFRQALGVRHDKLAMIPLVSYGVTEPQIEDILDEGLFFFKIKIGSDPDKDGDQDKMLEWDKQRLSRIHEMLKDREIPYSENGRIPYYLDANGRYESKDRLMRLLDHADSIGALERILIVEEPFPEELKVDVSDVPARLAADESAHSDKDAVERIELGYGAIALKPIAKTMSMSLRIARVAFDRDVPCFCADLTVNPILVDWNKNVAARMKALPGMKVGAMETNGHQNYAEWKDMASYHPRAGASWTSAKDGVFNLGDDFYSESAGILEDSSHYLDMVRPEKG